MGATTSMCGAPAATVSVVLDSVSANKGAPGSAAHREHQSNEGSVETVIQDHGSTISPRNLDVVTLPGAAVQSERSDGVVAVDNEEVRSVGGAPSVAAETDARAPVSVAGDAKFSQAGVSSSGTVPPPGGGLAGLAARRNFQGSITVAKKTDVSTPAKASRYKKITWCPRLKDLYEFKGEVMPSCHAGMQVLLAKQKSSGLEVVIKVRIKKSSFKEDEEKEWRVSTEYMMNLPVSGNIAKIHEVLEDVDAYYVVMEKCAGQDLFESIHNDSKLSIMETKETVHQILTALVELHKEGLVHKDLKLENVMIDRTPSTSTSAKQIWGDDNEAKSPVSVKIVDFDTGEEHTPKTPKRAKDVLGTDQYIAQEAYAGHYSPASDIFAVGVIAYRLLVGRFPFDARMFNDKPGENWVGSPKMKEIREKLCKYNVNYDHRVFVREPLACQLIKSMLSMKEHERPSAQDALNHPWFLEGRSSCASMGSQRQSAGSRGRSTSPRAS